MNVAMWVKALQTIPRITKKEWNELDIISRWLIASRAGVLVITFISVGVAGLLAYRDGAFNLGLWLLVAVGLLLAHATNNLLNDVTDYVKGVDKNNYFRAQYGPHPLEHGLLTMRQELTYAAVTGILALIVGAYLVSLRGLPGAGAAGAGRLLCAVLHLAAEIHRPGRDCRAAGMGPADDRRRLFCDHRPLELERGGGWPAVRHWRHHGDFWQTHRQIPG